MKSLYRYSLYGAGMLALTMGVLGGSTGYLRAQAVTVYNLTDLGTAPPDLTVSVSPNIAVTFDDSGSMGSTGLPDTLDGQQGNPFYYSSTTNFVYYNPNLTYTPPLNSAGTARFPDADYYGAWNDGICANSGGGCTNTRNLSKNFNSRFATNTTSGVSANNGGTVSIPSSAMPSSRDNGAMYWTCPTNGSNSGCKGTTVNDLSDTEQQNFANWYSYYRTRNLMTRSAIADVFGGLGNGIRVVYQNLNDKNYKLKGGTTQFLPFDGTARSSFFTWLYQVSASGGTPTRVAIKAAGDLFTYGQNITNSTNPYWEPLKKNVLGTGRELSCRLNYSLLVTDGYWNGDDPGILTPTTRSALSLPDGVSYTGSNSDPNTVIYSNVPDGSYVDGNGRTVKYSSLSDLGFYYWATNLRPDFKNGNKPKLDVPPSFVDYTDANGKVVNWDGTGTPPRSLYFNPKNDPATWPHVTQFMITLGINGSLNYPGDYAALRNGTKSWPMPLGYNNGDLTDIDDTWHTAINSRGQYFSAGDPSQLSNALNVLLARIIARSASTVAGALSSSVLTGNGVTYQSGFDSSNWSGSLVANIIGLDGTIGKQLWSASDILTAQAKAGDTRVILTSTATGAGNGAAFRWDSISTALKGADKFFTDDNGASVVAYLRGDTTNEGSLYRRRTTTLGAIINSQTVYVAYPASGYTDTFPASDPESSIDPTTKLKFSYEKFVNDHAKRAPTIYVGANDGMLHAFDATTATTPPESVDVPPSPGKERWAYVPFGVYSKLEYLTPVSSFQLYPTVDATPVTRDVFFSGANNKGWHSILVGGLRLGGRGIYALDITDASASESNPGAKVLWEFTNKSTDAGNAVGANLGYTYGKPNIGRLANGKWVVLVPSGYFPKSSADPYKSDQTDAAAARTQSSLFVLDAQTGQVLRELVTPTSASGISNITSFGLSSPVLGDYNNDQIDDVAFAGDLQGNLWRFDLSSSDASKWSVSLAFYSANQGVRPITVMPRLFADPISSNFMVVFGTGKYLGGSDNTTSDTQYIYGIRDSGPGSTAAVIEGTTPMVQQLLTENSSNTRGLTTYPVPATNDKGVAIGGWAIQLFTGSPGSQTNAGERVVVDATALFDSGRAIITSLLPGSTDPCAPVRKGAILVIDAATGGAASGVSAGSGSVGAGYTQAGVRVNNVPVTGALPAATAVGGGKIALPGLTITDSSGANSTFSIGDAIWRRRSWRELNNAY